MHLDVGNFALTMRIIPEYFAYVPILMRIPNEKGLLVVWHEGAFISRKSIAVTCQ